MGEKACVALCVTWAAGFVDMTGYLRLAHILTANMTGNTIRVSLGAASLDWNVSAQRLWPVLAFLAGLILSAVIHEAGVRRGLLTTSAIVFAIEAGLLACFMVLSASVWAGDLRSNAAAFYTSTALLALGMGLQNATVTRVGALSIKTTHVTGTITNLAESLAQFLFWLYDRLRAPFFHRWQRVCRTAWRQKPVQEGALTASLWIAFLFGGICAVLGLRKWGNASLLTPVAVLLSLAVLDLRRPLAASDEHKAEP